MSGQLPWTIVILKMTHTLTPTYTHANAHDCTLHLPSKFIRTSIKHICGNIFEVGISDNIPLSQFTLCIAKNAFVIDFCNR